MLASLGPLAARLGKDDAGYWPGFFYAPFYTTNVFTDAQTPAGQAGLHPEDRVVGVNLVRIEQLWSWQEQTGPQHGSITLLYELGRELTLLPVAVEPLGWGRILTVWVPLLLAAFGLFWLGWRRHQPFPKLAGLVLLAAIDYWLNPGAGRLSGFAPDLWFNLGQGWLALSKWSAYLYWPLWTFTLAVGGWFLVSQIWASKALQFSRALLVIATLTEAASYGYDAWKSGNYNNPDYIIWHARAVFWPKWLIMVGLSGLVAWRTGRWGVPASLLVFVAGFAFPTTFDTALPGPGPQWYALALCGFVYWNWPATAASNSAGWFRRARPKSSSI